MKISFRFFSLFLALGLLVSSCKNTVPEVDKETPDQATVNEAAADQMTGFTVSGEVRSMTTKAALKGVAVQGPTGPAYTTNDDGLFVIYFPSKTTTQSMTYTKTDYESLQQDYVNIKQHFVEKIIVYMEDTGTQRSDSKSVKGRTFKRAAPPNPGQIPLKDILVIEQSKKDSSFSNANGNYLVGFNKDKPTFEYQFKITLIGGTMHTVSVVNKTSIKDSTQIDMVFTTNAGGVEILPGEKD